MDSKIFLLLTSCFLLLTSFALTRAEIIERFRAVPVVKVEGLVQVVADCPAEMRREFQLPVAGFAADTCRALYTAERLKPQRFVEPGIVVHIGDVRTNLTNVVSRVHTRAHGAPYTAIYVPAPGFADRHALVLAIARAYFLAVHGKTVDDKFAWHTLLSSSPALRAAESSQRLLDWSQRGIYVPGMDDEDYLKLARKVLLPGELTPHERTMFISRLYLYPLSYDAPFCGQYTALDFASAVRLRKRDLSIRLMAFIKARQILIFGAGHGEGLQVAADAYAAFLTELGRDEKTEGELLALLAIADAKMREL